MLSSSPTSCTSPTPDGESPGKKLQWASEKKRRRTSSTGSESKAHADPSKASRFRRSSRLTVKYDLGQLQRWLEMEEWVDAQIQVLFQVSGPLGWRSRQWWWGTAQGLGAPARTVAPRSLCVMCIFNTHTCLQLRYQMPQLSIMCNYLKELK